MADITASGIKALRDKTGAGMMECKNALTEAAGNEEQAIDILRKRGLASAKKREGRIAAEGAVGSYIHMGGKVGVLVEVNCETYFVARSDEFQQLIKDVAMHIAASEPRFVGRDEVTSAALDKEREIARAQTALSGSQRALTRLPVTIVAPRLDALADASSATRDLEALRADARERRLLRFAVEAHRAIVEIEEATAPGSGATAREELRADARANGFGLYAR